MTILPRAALLLPLLLLPACAESPLPSGPDLPRGTALPPPGMNGPEPAAPAAAPPARPAPNAAAPTTAQAQPRRPAASRARQ